MPLFDPDTLTGFLDASQIEGLRQVLGSGLKTAEDFFDVSVQFEERNDATGKYTNIGDPVDLISISFGLREVRSSTGEPIVIRSSSGDMRIWEGSFDLKVGYRFTFQGERVEVTAVYPPQNGFIVAELGLVQ